MAKSTKKTKKKTVKKSKKTGRPRTTGAGSPMVVRMHTPMLKDLDAWIAAQEGTVSRPEAIRRLVGRALQGGEPQHQPKEEAAGKRLGRPLLPTTSH